MYIIPKSLWIEKLFDQCEQDEDLRFRDKYSGRAMYGKTCIGIVGPKHYIEGAIKRAEKEILAGLDEDEYAEEDVLWFEATWDSMGLDAIAYWPTVSVDPT